MKLAALHPALIGHWQGDKQLWLNPTDAPHTSASTLSIAPVANGCFISGSYTWAWEGKPQQGFFVAGDANEKSEATAAWGDSWHQSGKVMSLTGAVSDGALRLAGHYTVPGHPDWGWWLALVPQADGGLWLEMHNVEPDGTAHLAVRIGYRRAG